jgi:hypothetical protein
VLIKPLGKKASGAKRNNIFLKRPLKIMNNQTIGDIYATNDKIREKTKRLVASLTDRQTSDLPEGEKWTIAEIVEHIAIVQDGNGENFRETFDAGSGCRKIFGRRGAAVGKFRCEGGGGGDFEVRSTRPRASDRQSNRRRNLCGRWTRRAANWKNCARCSSRSNVRTLNFRIRLWAI